MVWASYDYFTKLRQVLGMVWANYDYFKKPRQVLKMVWSISDYFKKLRQVLKMVWASSDYFKKLWQVLRMVWLSQFSVNIPEPTQLEIFNFLCQFLRGSIFEYFRICLLNKQHSQFSQFSSKLGLIGYSTHHM